MTNSFANNGLFGDLFVDSFVVEAFSAQHVAQNMIQFEQAWSEALGALEIVPIEVGGATSVAMQNYAPDLPALAAASTRDGLPVPELVRQLKKHVGPDLEAAVHQGATSQDVIDSAMALTLRRLSDEYDTRLARILDRLATLGAAQTGVQIMGRTRMQAALPIPVSARIAAWRKPLENHRAALESLRENVEIVQVGGAVGLRDTPEGFGPLVAMNVAETLNLGLTEVWHSDRSGPVSYGHWLTLVAGSLGKMGQDIALMAQQGVDEIKLSGGGGSSAMPHKQNPILAETLVSLARYVGGQQGILSGAMLHEQERSGSAWTLEWMVLPAMAEATGAALRHAETLLDQIERIGPAPK
jgi:3-carboxy-cis,cis-muconate cycloisomerase